MKKLFVLLLLLTMAGCSKENKIPAAKDLVHSHNQKAGESINCTLDLEIDIKLDQDHENKDLSTSVYSEIKAANGKSHVMMNVKAKSEDEKETQKIEIWSDEDQSYFYQDAFGSWIKLDPESDEYNYPLDTSINEDYVKDLTVEEVDGLYRIQISESDDSDTYDLIDSLINNSGLLVDLKYDDITTNYYFDPATSLLTKMEIDPFDIEAEVEGTKAIFTINFNQTFNFDELEEKEIAIPDFVSENAREKVYPYSTLYFYGNAYTLPSMTLYQDILAANYQLTNEDTELGIEFTDPDELFNIYLTGNNTLIKKDSIKNIEDYGISMFNMSEIYENTHAPVGIGGVMLGSSYQDMIAIYGDNYQKESNEYIDQYTYKIGRTNNQSVVFTVYKANNQIITILIGQY